MEWSGTSGAKERGEGRDLRPEHRGEGRSERAKVVIGRAPRAGTTGTNSPPQGWGWGIHGAL